MSRTEWMGNAEVQERRKRMAARLTRTVQRNVRARLGWMGESSATAAERLGVTRAHVGHLLRTPTISLSSLCLLALAVGEEDVTTLLMDRPEMEPRGEDGEDNAEVDE